MSEKRGRTLAEVVAELDKRAKSFERRGVDDPFHRGAASNLRAMYLWAISKRKVVQMPTLDIADPQSAEIAALRARIAEYEAAAVRENERAIQRDELAARLVAERDALKAAAVERDAEIERWKRAYANAYKLTAELAAARKAMADSIEARER